MELADQQTRADAGQRQPLSPLHDMSHNTPLSKFGSNAELQQSSESDVKPVNTPTRPPSGNRANRRTSTDVMSGQKSPRRTVSGFAEGKAQGERVKVVVRLRPPFPHENGGAVTVNADHTGISVFRERSSIPQSEFGFDKILPEDSVQADVYQAAVKPVVEDVLNGYNGTIMAYGQTGAGKTYTLSSIQPDAIGMIPRAAAEVFAHISKDVLNEYTVFMSYIQIYMEMIQDLLRPENENLQIRESETGVFVAGVHEKEVKGMEDCLHLLQLGERNRVFAFTRLNAHSSRSHAIVMLTIIKRRRTLPGQEAGPLQKVRIGKLFMVDLAGSERLKKSLSTGLRASEAKSINLSLTSLGMCINARADPNSTHVPFRDSKLTRLLQESLGGNAKTSLVIAVANAEEHVDESLQSLQFGSRAMRILTRAMVNERTDVKTAISPEILAQLEQTEDQANALALTLLAKENELEQMQGDLQEERQRSSAVAAALQQERRQIEEQQAEVIRQQEAQLEAEREQREALAQQLQHSKDEGESLQQQHEREKETLQQEADKAWREVGRLDTEAQQAATKAAQEIDSLLHSHAMSQDMLQQKMQMEQDAAVHRQQLQTEKHQHALQLSQEALTAAQAEVQRLQQKHAQDTALSERRWQQRVDRADTLLQQQSERAQTLAASQDASISQLRGQIDMLNQTVHSLDDSLSTLKTDKLSIEQENEQMRDDRRAQAADVSHLRSQLDTVNQTVHNLEDSLSALKLEKLSLTHENKQLRDETRAQAADISQLRSQLDTLSVTVHKLDDSLSVLNDEKLSLSQHNEQLRDENRMQAADISQLHGQLDTANQTVRSLDHSLSALHAEKLSMSQESEQRRDDAQRLQSDVQGLRGFIDELQMSVRGLQDQVAQTKGERDEALRLNAALLQEHEELQQLMAQEASRHQNAEGILESQLATTTEQYHQLQQQTEAKDRNQTDLGALWLNNKRRNNAARLIQRRWRLWRGSNHEARFGRDAEAMHQLSSAARDLAQEKAHLQQQHQAHLASTGQAMVGDSMKGMREAVETVRAAFLLPQKDLKNLSIFQQKLSSFSSPSGGSVTTPRHDSAAWAIRASSATGGGFSPFITPVSTPRVASISRVASVNSSDAGSTPRWASSSYGPAAPADTGPKSTPRSAPVSVLATPPRMPAAIASMPLVPAVLPSTSGLGAAGGMAGSPAGGAARAPLPIGPRRTFSSKYGTPGHPPGQQPGVTGVPFGQGSAPRRTRSNLSDSPSQYYSPRHTSDNEELNRPLESFRRITSQD